MMISLLPNLYLAQQLLWLPFLPGLPHASPDCVTAHCIGWCSTAHAMGRPQKHQIRDTPSNWASHLCYNITSGRSWHLPATTYSISTSTSTCFPRFGTITSFSTITSRINLIPLETQWHRQRAQCKKCTSLYAPLKAEPYDCREQLCSHHRVMSGQGTFVDRSDTVTGRCVKMEKLVADFTALQRYSSLTQIIIVTGCCRSRSTLLYFLGRVRHRFGKTQRALHASLFAIETET